jgi:ElaB/YqjD/DUF883 family membrane-anchored ribosome-binding protein
MLHACVLPETALPLETSHAIAVPGVCIHPGITGRDPSGFLLAAIDVATSGVATGHGSASAYQPLNDRIHVSGHACSGVSPRIPAALTQQGSIQMTHSNTGFASTPPEHASSTSDASSTMDQAKEKGEEALSTAKERAGDMASQAQARTDQGMQRAAEGMSHAAEALRQRGEGQSGAMGTAASTAANTLDEAGSYLRDKDTDQLLQDIEALIRRKPVESLLVAAGAGFVLSKLFG